MKIKLLKQKDFSLLMLGKLVSLIGTQMQNFALSLYVLKITGSATKFASVLAITLIPQLLLGPIAGVFVDWLDRKKIIVYLDIASGVIVGIYVFIFMMNGGLSLGSIYILAILLSLASLLFQPAIGTVIPSIVDKEDLVDANGMNSFIMNIGNLAAPAIAGILFGLYGLFIILVVNSISFILSGISEMFINIPKLNKKPTKFSYAAFHKDFVEGIKFIKNKKIMLSIILLGLTINFVADPVFTIGLTYISKNVLKVTDSQFGLVESVFVASMMVAPFIASKVSKKVELGKLLFLDMIVVSIFIGILAVVPSAFYLSLFDSNLVPYISMLGIIFMIGLVISIANIAIGVMFQKEIPLEMMGRVGTVMSTGCMAAIPLGRIVFGFLVDRIEVWICVAVCAVILFVSIMMFKGNLCNRESENKEVEVGRELETV